jgi:hypothetical protein
LCVDVSRAVVVLEVSAGGILLGTPALSAEKGEIGEFHARLTGVPFKAHVRLYRVDRQRGQVAIGAAFEWMEPQATRLLEKTLAQWSQRWLSDDGGTKSDKR